MKYIRCVLITIVILSLFLLYSCLKGEVYLNFEISSQDKSLIDLSSKMYSQSQLIEIVAYNGSITDLNNKYPIECIRNDNGTYRVAYLGDEDIAMLYFDTSGNKVLGKIYHAHMLKCDFDGLLEGQSIEFVRNIDPDGDYLFLYTGRNDSPKVSYHCTKDGYFITIEYDDKNNITSWKMELI